MNQFHVIVKAKVWYWQCVAMLHFILWFLSWMMLHDLRYVDTSSGESIAHLPYRVLPPGSVRMLWVQFGSKCSYLGNTSF